MGKMIVLKPVVWNPNGYRFPAGIDKKGKDYVAQWGLGHEEWNGAPERIWEGQRVFHTEVKGRMEDYGKRGDLGIIMTAYSDAGPHAVGVATNVRFNSRSQRTAIAKTVRAAAHAQAMWDLPSVRKRFACFTDFERFWKEESCDQIPWRCPPDQYEWFDKPVRLNSAELFPPTTPGGKPPQIVKMYSTYMAIRPDQALAVIRDSLDEESPIIKWVESGTFDEVTRKTRSHGPPKANRGSTNHNSTPPAASPYVRYLQSQELTVTPRHHEVQTRFETYVRSIGASEIRANQVGIDIQFTLRGRGHVLAEIKPCDKSDARFAVRTAMGQLLDYEQRHSMPKVHLLVVLETKPSAEDNELAIENGFGIAYPRAGRFIIKWPR